MAKMIDRDEIIEAYNEVRDDVSSTNWYVPFVLFLDLFFMFVRFKYNTS